MPNKFQGQNITRDKDQFIVMKGSIHQDMVILNVDASNNRASKCMMQRWTASKYMM